VVQAGQPNRTLGTAVLRTAKASPGVTPQRSLTSRFIGDSATLTPSSLRALRGAARGLRSAGAVAVYGYSSAPRPGIPPAAADRLSRARARQVAVALRRLRVTVVVVRGYGARHPVRGGAAANRRAVTGWIM
jgi:outer membrane protein OmpA-like peptidoglycan-associated protein